MHMLFGRIFLLLNALVALSLGGWAVLQTDFSAYGITADGPGLIEVRTALGGAWLTFGVLWLAGAIGRRVRTGMAQLAGFYAITAVCRFLAMQAGGGTQMSLMFLVFEIAVFSIASWMYFVTLAPADRRIFGSKRG